MAMLAQPPESLPPKAAAQEQAPGAAGADHPLKEQTRARPEFGTAAQQSTVESGAAASQNTAAVTDQPAARIKPDA